MTASKASVKQIDGDRDPTFPTTAKNTKFSNYNIFFQRYYNIGTIYI